MCLAANPGQLLPILHRDHSQSHCSRLLLPQATDQLASCITEKIGAFWWELPQLPATSPAFTHISATLLPSLPSNNYSPWALDPTPPTCQGPHILNHALSLASPKNKCLDCVSSFNCHPPCPSFLLPLTTELLKSVAEIWPHVFTFHSLSQPQQTGSASTVPLRWLLLGQGHQQAP